MMRSNLLSAPLTVLLVAGCLGPNPYLDAGADETAGLPDGDPGTWWCAEFPNPPGAEAYYSLGPPLGSPQAITTDGTTGNPPRECRCAHPELADFLHDNLEQGVVYIDGDLINAWDALNADGETAIHFRDHLFGAVSDRCENLADTHHDSRLGDNCQQAYQEVSFGTIPLAEDNNGCYAWLTYGEEENTVPLPTDSWSDYFTLREEITYYSGWDLYVINGGFFNSMLQTPAWILEDGVFVDLNGNDDYQLYNVTSGTIAHALGLQSGDIPQTLNDIDITTIDGVLEAWTDLRSETQFELVILRGTNTVTLEYYVAYTF